MKNLIILSLTLLVWCVSFAQDWQWLNPLPQGNFLTEVHFTDSNNGYAVGWDWNGSNNGIILKTSNGGLDWTKQFIAPECFFNSVSFTGINTGYAVGRNGIIIKTNNGGNTWTILYSGTSVNLNSVYFTDINSGYIVRDDGKIMSTINGGDSWMVDNSGTCSALNSICFTDDNTGYIVGCCGIILKTINGGGLPTEIKDSPIQPSTFNIQHYPNPTSGIVDFRWSMVDGRWVSLKIYDVHGREVATVLDEKLPAGEHTVRWDAGGLPPGIYYYRLTTDDRRLTTETGKIVKY